MTAAKTWLFSILVGIMAAASHAADLPYRLRTSPEGIQLDRVIGRQADPLLKSIRYAAYIADGMAFQTQGIQAQKLVSGSTWINFVLTGPRAAQASVTVLLTPKPGSVKTHWTVRWTGSAQKWNGSRTGFQMEYAQRLVNAATTPATRFIRPTGDKPYEVKGDTPYRDLEWQLREVSFAKSRLVVATQWYDPDWIYRRQLSRASNFPVAFPKEMPGEATYDFSLVPLSAAMPSVSSSVGMAADSAASAAGRPLSLLIQSPAPANLFLPGQTACFTIRLHNVTAWGQKGVLQWHLWDYYGHQAAGGVNTLFFAPAGSKQIAVSLPKARRGMLFLEATLTAGNTRWLDRTTFGILPKAPSAIPKPQSPFGIAGIICSPETYPDQKSPAEVLEAAHRIGARWIRFGVPLAATSDSPEQALLARYGLSGHIQIYTGLPAPGQDKEFQAQIRSTLQRLPNTDIPIEFGNELNLAGVAPADYVNQLLRPVHNLTRAMRPQSKILSMGLGGVDKKWLDGFVAAGGMDLIDVLSVHPGCQPRAPEFWKGYRGWVFRPQVQDALLAAGRKEVWLSETYAPTPPDRVQLDVRTAADYLVRTYLVSLALGVRVVEWYQLQDGVWFAQRPNPADTEYNYGLLYTDLTPKPGYVAYGTLTEQLEGKGYAGRRELGADDLYGLNFGHGPQQVTVLWSYREKHETDLDWWPPEQFKNKSRKPGEPWVNRWHHPVSVKLPATNRVFVTDILGNSHILMPKNGFVSLGLTGSPVYVRGLSSVPSRKNLW